MSETQIREAAIYWSKTPTELLVGRGAPRLPGGYTYRLEIKHPSLINGGPVRAASVTARIGHVIGDEWVEVARFTEVTRADLGMATVAACKHAYEVGYENGRF